VGAAPRRSHLAGGVVGEADGAGGLLRAERRRHGDDAVRRQTDGVADAAVVREPPLLDAPFVPLEVAQHGGGEAQRERQELGDLGRHLLLPAAHVVLGENDVILLPRLVAVGDVSYYPIGFLTVAVVVEVVLLAGFFILIVRFAVAAVAAHLVGGNVNAVSFSFGTVAVRCHGKPGNPNRGPYIYLLGDFLYLIKTKNSPIKQIS
jgi:hypothetical protein